MLLRRTRRKDALPYNVLSLDSEDQDGYTYIWSVQGTYNGRTINRTFTDRRKVVDFLFHRRWPNTVLTGMNLDYDLNTLKFRGGFNWHCIYNMGRLITAYPLKHHIEKWKLQNKAIKIIELSNWILNRSLKTVCDDFGIEGHIDKHVLDRDGDLTEMIEACTSHANCGSKAFEYIQAQLSGIGGRCKLTASSTALDFFLLHHLKEEHQIYDFKTAYPSRLGLYDNATPEEFEVARIRHLGHMRSISGLTYVGGRTEAFRLGLIPHASSIDINSSYPYQMRDITLPDMNTYFQPKPSTTKLYEALEDYEGCAHIRIQSPPICKIPLLHSLHSHKLIFPVGRFSGWYTFPEIRTALSNNYKILDTYEIGAFSPLEGFFTSYVDQLYKLKESKQTKFMGKLLMNGLSGKFGQRKPNGSYYEICEEDGVIVDNKTYFVFGDLLYKYYPPTKEVVEYVHTAYPLISAYILAKARLYIWDHMKYIGFDNCYYCDTDSIHAHPKAIQDAVDTGLIRIHDTDLGAWSYDYQDGVLEIRGLKYYRYHEQGGPWIYKIKGVRAEDHAQYWRDKAIWMQRSRKIKTAIRTNQQVNEFFRFYRHDIPQEHKRAFDHRYSEPFEIF